MKNLTFLLIAVLMLTACDDQKGKSKEQEKDVANKEMLEGKFTNSPVLDYRKYTTESPPSAKPSKEAPGSSPGGAPTNSGFKKSPTLDYRKYLGEEGKP